MTSDLLAFGAVVLMVAVAGLVIGMLVAPLIGRLAGQDHAEAEGDGSDEPA